MPVLYPSTLPRPLQSGYNRATENGLRESQPMAGPPLSERTTFDMPSRFNLTWQLSQGEARVFWAWYKSALDDGNRTFQMDLLVEDGMQPQECKFIAGGHPQLTGVNADEYTYTAQVVVRRIESPDAEDYDFILQLAEISPNGDINQGLALLDIAINEVAP